ncbi:MAG: class I SAM-dependent methyltransferase [Desulfofustis sp.]|nr:class I SAM-dependent methyltransferase [Desulfofustis sp.]MBT8353355.1 class I SAM-dependent methyltransferase [Desulfofustis sp.]NNF47970.1 class I SAM-dependent methyltransferase [Desulfofustis sp.]NNK57760.1 class I SAM-dependent methyltransferase [Desulfofustis sp.]
MDIKPQIAVLKDSTTTGTTAELIDLARRLNLPLINTPDPNFSHVLTFCEARLELHTLTTAKRSPLSVDFLSGPAYYRFIHDRRISQPLAKAVGIKRGYRPKVLDGTAGFGEDGFVLASLGCTVTMIERSPIIWALLADAVTRSMNNQAIGAIFNRNVTLKLADTIDYLSSSSNIHDTVFLDPMYPSLPKSSLNKQRMRTLRELVGDDHDGSELLNVALKGARKRVAVKRPIRAVTLDDRKPTFTIPAKSSRYDIYLIPYL